MKTLSLVLTGLISVATLCDWILNRQQKRRIYHWSRERHFELLHCQMGDASSLAATWVIGSLDRLLGMRLPRKIAFSVTYLSIVSACIVLWPFAALNTQPPDDFIWIGMLWALIISIFHVIGLFSSVYVMRRIGEGAKPFEAVLMAAGTVAICVALSCTASASILMTEPTFSYIESINTNAPDVQGEDRHQGSSASRTERSDVMRIQQEWSPDERGARSSASRDLLNRNMPYLGVVFSLFTMPLSATLPFILYSVLFLVILALRPVYVSFSWIQRFYFERITEVDIERDEEKFRPFLPIALVVSVLACATKLIAHLAS